MACTTTRHDSDGSRPSPWGHTPSGKRIVGKASGRTRTEARNRLKELVRDHDDGVLIAAQSYTVQQAVQDWPDHGLGGRDPSTVQTLRDLALRHVVPALGRRKMRALTWEHVDLVGDLDGVPPVPPNVRVWR
ncbi:hypothetical protein [Pseudonocardia oceani]|uniref:hypothetical protein n=1 Tax=Pseudonocardia oceani TaxID=2792013 RepID=UPI001CEDEF83|nr:hypothetical protein [Pseudonocardia oceani]